MNKSLMIGCLIMAMALSVHGATMCSGESASVTLDLVTGTRAISASETIRYSTAWVDGAVADAMAIVEVNGEPLSSMAGSGAVTWTPQHNGNYTLTHKVMSGGTQIGETLTAMFFVEPANPVLNPVSGTTFDSSLSVSMTCPTEGATIHYTTDGSEPTAESPEYKRFKISGKTTVRAIAEKNGLLSEVVTAEYALGQCADPVFSLADGAEFEHSNQEVSIAWNNDGVLRYTLDGSEPTVESPIYEGPFSFSESVVVKAKVFSDDFFDSSVVTASLTRVWVNVATPVVDASSSFTGSKTKVSISCATEGAVVRYTLDGNEPNSHSTKYTGPFYVTDSCTVKAYAVMPDYLDSEVAAFAIEKVWAIGDTMGKPDHGFTTGGSGGAGWTRVTDATAPNGEAMKSGAITHSQSSVLSTKVMGPGTLSFSWRTSCEQDDDYEWDHAELAVDGVVKLRLNGVTEWTAASMEITGDGEHTIEWRYLKDDVEGAGEDAAWVANYSWASAEPYTHTTEVPVSYAWLAAHEPGVVDEYESYEVSAKATAANGWKVWECYVVGLDPQKMDVFRISAFPMKADGTPDLENLALEPAQSEWNVPGARAVIMGAATLGGEWQTVTEENKALFRFFRVVVELP
ncbi:MAG: chitobiase/beta-hexosaminidase C-terminal domain-containing protein [Kiritimatiellae bacterium]|nr:chitobiase/beta-hexosaminidase C-terminal domain-containing protein [Kiritimatiellia bacterium]